MAELILGALEGPSTGDGSQWWVLNATVSDRSEGVLSEDGTLNVYPFFPTNSELTLDDSVQRILIPSVNAKFDSPEIENDYGINANSISNDALRQLAQDGVTPVVEDSFSTSINGISDPRFDDPENSRQPTTEGPVAFDSDGDGDIDIDDLHADGYYTVVNASALPSFTDGIVVQNDAALDLSRLGPDAENSLYPEPGDPAFPQLRPVYEDLATIGIFRPSEFVNQQFTFNFDFSSEPSNGRDLIEGGGGPDTITGLGGNDNISGGGGSDILNGTSDNLKGVGEIDILNGGGGRDTFILGGDGSPYYVGGGNLDYAIIEDLQRNDTIQLGTADFTLSEDNQLLGNDGISIFVGNDLVGFALGASSEVVEGAIV